MEVLVSMQGAGSGEAMSAHERRVARMAERARALEAQNLVQKDWFMRGEAGAGAGGRSLFGAPIDVQGFVVKVSETSEPTVTHSIADC